MCSVIEIKNNNEYYIHYHSPDSLEPCSMDPDDNQPEEDHHHSDNEDKLEADKDCSVGEITHSPPTKDPGKADDKTSDKGSSLDGDESETPSSHKSTTNDSPQSSPSKHCSDVPITVNSHIPAHPSRSSSIPVLTRNRTVEIGTQMERDQTKNQRNDDHDIKAEQKRRSSSVPSPVLKSDIKSWDERQLERAQSKSKERDTTSPSKIPIKVDHRAKKGSLSVSSLFERSEKSKTTPEDKHTTKEKSNSISNLKIEKDNKPQISSKAASQESKKKAEEAKKLEKSKANDKKKQKKALKATAAEEEKKSPKAKKVAENTKEKAKRVLSFRRSKKEDTKDKTKPNPDPNGEENKTAPPADSTDGLKILETKDGYFVLSGPKSEPTIATTKEYMQGKPVILMHRVGPALSFPLSVERK